MMIDPYNLEGHYIISVPLQQAELVGTSPTTTTVVMHEKLG